MRVSRVRATFRSRSHSERPIRDALQTLSGGGWVDVEVESDGLVGTSTTYFGRVDGAPRSLAVLVEEVLAPEVVGKEAEYVGRIVEALKAETDYLGTAGLATFGISAIDVALWDLLGRAHDVPVHRLWGAYRDRIPAYAMVGWVNFEIDELRRQCAAAVVQGFGGVKLKVGAAGLDDDVARIEGVRAEVGPDVSVMVDANQALSFDEAVRRGEVYGELGVDWFEEPIRADDIDGYAELTSRLRVPIATGENLYGARQFRDFFHRRALDIVQPDLRRAGGPTELLGVGAMAAAHGLTYASHGGGAAALSVLTSVASARWLETGLKGPEDRFPVLEGGCALAPVGPGFSWEP